VAAGGEDRFRLRAQIPPLTLLITLFLGASSISAHAFLETSDPAANSVLAI
jgi:hypothetical protein